MTVLAKEKIRYPLIDTVRGVAILLMIVYHFSWDLTFFGMANFQIFTDPVWIWFAKIIVSIILMVMGVSQVMARKKPFTAAVFLRRFGLISGSAAAVTIITYWMDPASYVFFGILHHIALTSLILSALIFVPSLPLLLLAVIVLAAPGFLTHPVFEIDWLLWVGLTPVTPVSIDYVPLVPWLAVPIVGVVTGRWILQNEMFRSKLHWRPTRPASRIVNFAGRNSLIIYLAHQPILYGGLYLLANIRGQVI